MKHKSVFAFMLMLACLFVVAVGAQSGSGDYGDAPETYANAYHSQPGEEWLGASGTPSVTSEDAPNRVNLDPLDDGVTSSGRVTISLSANAPPGTRYLSAWVDANDDGAWSGGEQVIVDLPVTVAPGRSTGLAFPALGSAFGVHWLRVTVTRQPLGSGTGGAVNATFGETEDYPGSAASDSPPPTPTATVYDPVPPPLEPTAPVPPDERCRQEVELWRDLFNFARYHGANAGGLRAAFIANPGDTTTALARHLSTVPASDFLSDALIAELLRVVEEVWLARVPATPDVTRAYVSERYAYQANVPRDPVEHPNYDEYQYADGEVYLQPIRRAENAVGIGATLDCEAYGNRFFERSGLTPDGNFEPRVINGVPFCRYVIVGDGFFQWEMAFWHPGLGQPFGMSLIARDPLRLLSLLVFWFTQVEFMPLPI